MTLTLQTSAGWVSLFPGDWHQFLYNTVKGLSSLYHFSLSVPLPVATPFIQSSLLKFWEATLPKSCFYLSRTLPWKLKSCHNWSLIQFSSQTHILVKTTPSVYLDDSCLTDTVSHVCIIDDAQQANDFPCQTQQKLIPFSLFPFSTYEVITPSFSNWKPTNYSFFLFLFPVRHWILHNLLSHSVSLLDTHDVKPKWLIFFCFLTPPTAPTSKIGGFQMIVYGFTMYPLHSFQLL